MTIEEIALEQSKIPKLSTKKQLEMLRESGNAIKYIHNPSEAVCLEAVKQDKKVIPYIRKDLNKVLTKKKLNYILNVKKC